MVASRMPVLSTLFLSQGCLFPFSTLGLPFPAVPAVPSDRGLFIAMTAAIELGTDGGGCGCSSPLWLHLRAEASGAELRALVSGRAGGTAAILLLVSPFWCPLAGQGLAALLGRGWCSLSMMRHPSCPPNLACVSGVNQTAVRNWAGQTPYAFWPPYACMCRFLLLGRNFLGSKKKPKSKNLKNLYI